MNGRALVIALVLAPAAARADGPLVWLAAADAGVSLQRDQYVAGAHVGARVAAFPYAQLEVLALAGLGPDFVNLRTALRLRPRVEVNGMHASLIGGLALYSYFARGPFARFCDKADLDCSRTAFGFELGLGLGYRWAGVDAVFATGDVPLYTFTCITGSTPSSPTTPRGCARSGRRRCERPPARPAGLQGDTPVHRLPGRR